MDKLTEKQLEETTIRVSRDMALALNDDEAIDLVRGVIAALPKSEPVEVIFENIETDEWHKKTLYAAPPIAPPASEQKPRFDCWSTDQGDSWYESPADAELLCDVLGDSPKVGDEFEVIAGWRAVQTRYRIASQTGDDFDVECISHPDGKTAPQTNHKTQLDTLLARLDVISEVHVISATYNRIRTERIFAADDLEYDLFATGMKTAIEMMKGGA